MKKFVSAFVAASLVTLCAIPVFARVSPSAVALGGISPGDTLDSVKSKLGEPSYTHKDELTFANGLVVEVDHHRGGVIVEDVFTRTSGIETPAGVSVGSPESAINKYGKADDVDRDHDGKTEYKYYSTDNTKKMEFTVKNGTIVKIKCELR